MKDMQIILQQTMYLLLSLSKIKNYKFLIIFVICLDYLVAQAYSVSGLVLDSDTEQPIKNVNVYIEDSDFGTVTNDEGYFLLFLDNQIKNSTDLSIKIIGYKPQNLQLDLYEPKIDLGRIFLEIESLEIESIHIHSHKHQSNQISDKSFSGQNLNDILTGNIATTLSNQSNFGVSSFGAVTSKPVLRGYSDDRLLLTRDGNKIGDLSQTSIDHAIALDMMEVNKVEVVRGPKSLIYGPNPIGGVINTSIIGNPKVKVNKLYRNIMLGWESFNQGVYGNVSLYIPIKNNQLNITINNRKSDNQTSPTKELENTYSEVSNYKLGFTRYNDDGYINFIIEQYDMNYGIPPSLEGHIDGVDIEMKKNNIQVNYHKDISVFNLNQFDFNFNFIDYEHKEFENNVDYYTVLLGNKTYNFKTELQSSSVVIGSEFNYKQFFPGGFYWSPITRERDLSFYGFYDKKFHGFNLLSSFRMGYLSIQPKQENLIFSNINPQQIKNRDFKYVSLSIGLIKIFNNLELNSWVMSTMKAPRLEQLYSDGPHLGMYSYEIGQPNLELERIIGIESSIKYNYKPFNVSLTGFYNYSPYYYQMSKIGNCEEEFILGESHPCAGADFIEWGSGSAGWLYKYYAEGIESLVKGLEFNFNYNYQDFQIGYDFSLVRGDDITNKLPLSYMTPDKQKLNFQYQKGLMNYKLRLSGFKSQNRIGEFESYTPSSFLIDFILAYNKGNQNITIQFNNIFNKEHKNHLSRIKDIMPEPGRNIIFNYKIFF